MRVSFSNISERDKRSKDLWGPLMSFSSSFCKWGNWDPQKGKDLPEAFTESESAWVSSGLSEVWLESVMSRFVCQLPCCDQAIRPHSLFPPPLAMRCGILPHEVLLWHMLPEAWSGDPKETSICTQPVSHRAGERLWLFPGSYFRAFSQ